MRLDNTCKALCLALLVTSFAARAQDKPPLPAGAKECQVVAFDSSKLK